MNAPPVVTALLCGLLMQVWGCGRVGFDLQDAAPTDLDASSSDGGIVGSDSGSRDASADSSLTDGATTDGDTIDGGGRTDGGTTGDAAAPITCDADMRPFTSGRQQFCIEVDQRPSLNWQEAVDACIAAGRILCTRPRWNAACRAADPAVLNMLDGWEWANERGSLISVYAVGGSGCDTNRFFNESNRNLFRCCSP